MNIVRMAMISPNALGDGLAICRGPTTESRRAHRVKREIRPASVPRRAVWRQALIEAYPIVGMALFLAYFVWMFVSNINVAR